MKVKYTSTMPTYIQNYQKAVRIGLEKGASIIEREAKRNVAVDTGHLGQFITHVVEDTRAVIGTNVAYAPFVEFGTGIKAENGNGRKTPWWYKYEGNKGDKGWRFTYGSKPQPFLRPAFYGNLQTCKQIIANEIGKARAK
jgi:HK97 gp10 family phage protein